MIDSYSQIDNDLLSFQGNQLAFFKGSIAPKLLIVGEAPGPQENIAGEPFVGPAGIELHKSLDEISIDSSHVAFLNSVFRMPIGIDGKFRAPTTIEIEHYAPFVNDIILKLKPTVIMACGNTACQSLLKMQGINKLRGRWFGNILPTFHPSYILRAPQNRSVFLKDLVECKSKLI
ncbi:uracil-DNA glycosylase [Shewanella canadensis]|uniref:uracil-DNA glycosylase n=1 Tax=Shewanella canadensis TaxID=271096 RepID=UPI00163AAAAC|nr:uracil-DNA glycosylase [Shewanella canadensis]